jgi:hypothetical protein
VIFLMTSWSSLVKTWRSVFASWGKVPFRVVQVRQPERLKLVRWGTAFIRRSVLGLGKLLLSERASIGYWNWLPILVANWPLELARARIGYWNWLPIVVANSGSQIW